MLSVVLSWESFLKSFLLYNSVYIYAVYARSTMALQICSKTKRNCHFIVFRQLEGCSNVGAATVHDVGADKGAVNGAVSGAVNG
jgi:hypothetical protein